MAQPSQSGAGAHPEALENALLEALRAGLPIGSVERLTTLIQAEIQPISRAALEAEKGLSRSRASGVANFRGSFFEFLQRAFLPELERAILQAAPIPTLAAATDPTTALNVVEAAELLMLITRLLAQRGITTQIALDLADAILRAVRDFGAALSAALEGPAPPDVHQLTREVAKLELLRWLLEILEAPDHRQTLSTQLQVSARKALHRATAAITRFLTERQVDARRETAAVTAEIEDLVTLVLLLLDAEAESAAAESDNPFFHALSREEIAAFADRATALAERMFDELDGFVAGTGDADTLERPLRQVMTLSSFAGRLDAQVTLAEITRLRQVIARRLAALETRMGGRPRIQRADR